MDVQIGALAALVALRVVENSGWKACSAAVVNGFERENRGFSGQQGPRGTKLLKIHGRVWKIKGQV